jgi:hypothetical protein
VIVLAATVVALASAFDGCLLDCHAHARNVQTTAHAHCHPAPAQQASVRWQADSRCHHDHSAGAAEGAARSRFDSRVVGIVASWAADPHRPAISILSVPRSIGRHTAPTVSLAPLRV